jgi:hypothetical protein
VTYRKAWRHSARAKALQQLADAADARILQSTEPYELPEEKTASPERRARNWKLLGLSALRLNARQARSISETNRRNAKNRKRLGITRTHFITAARALESRGERVTDPKLAIELATMGVGKPKRTGPFKRFNAEHVGGERRKFFGKKRRRWWK